ncbi:hypothetical protein JOM56_015608 [Amanita muscaria]
MGTSTQTNDSDDTLHLSSNTQQWKRMLERTVCETYKRISEDDWAIWYCAVVSYNQKLSLCPANKSKAVVWYKLLSLELEERSAWAHCVNNLFTIYNTGNDPYITVDRKTAVSIPVPCRQPPLQLSIRTVYGYAVYLRQWPIQRFSMIHPRKYGGGLYPSSD